MISISVIWILAVSTYIPYSYIQTKNKISLEAKAISQIISKTHNYARNWLDNKFILSDSTEEVKNVKTAVYIPEWKWWVVTIYGFEFDAKNNPTGTWTGDEYIELKEEFEIESKKIDKQISIGEISDWNWNLDNIVIVFDAITWKEKLFTKDDLTDTLISIWDIKNFEVKVWVGEDFDNISLAEKLIYFWETNVIDIIKE